MKTSAPNDRHICDQAGATSDPAASAGDDRLSSWGKNADFYTNKLK